jgi:hypothetical protein
VEVPAGWRCEKGQEAAYWKGLKTISETAGPNWGEQLSDEAPSPFIWLVLYKNRDRDVAERRAPLTQRWAEFTGDEKCAYIRHYLKDAVAKKREYDALANWKQDEGMVKRLQKLGKDEVVEAQDKEPLKGWRTRFDLMHVWLSEQGLREDDATLERAYGVFIKLSLLETARLQFLLDSGYFSAQVRARFAKPGLTVKLDDPAAREAVIADLAEQLSKDWTNEKILGSDFERRVSEALKAFKRLQAVQAASARAEQVQRSAEEQRAAFKRAEAYAGRFEAEIKGEKFVFDSAADPALLITLEEYRQGKRKLAEALAGQPGEPDKEKLRASFVGLLRDVCVTHYVSIRYRAEVVKTLCGRAPEETPVKAP